MRIADGSLHQSAQYSHRLSYERQESMEFRAQMRANPPPAAGSAPSTRSAGVGSAGAGSAGAAGGASDPGEDVQLGPREAIALAILERIFGLKMQRTEAQPDVEPMTGTTSAEPASATEGEPSLAFGLRYDLVETFSEEERLGYQAEGMVHLEDGRSMVFSLAFTMERSRVEQHSISLRVGELSDPLFLTLRDELPGDDSQLSLDLNGDGRLEPLQLPSDQAALLALDRDGDGRLNTAGELFGPNTGDGFAELRELDEDGNGWIDENDSRFSQLRLTAGDGQLFSLSDAGVGALHVHALNSPFQLSNGQLRMSTVFLYEQGGVGLLQRLDFEV
jgi:hypothetical protein